MLLTPKYFEKLGIKPTIDNEHTIVYDFEDIIFVRWTKNSSFNIPMEINCRGGVLIVDYGNNYKVGEFKSLCDGLRIKLNSSPEPSKTTSEYGC